VAYLSEIEWIAQPSSAEAFYLLPRRSQTIQLWRDAQQMITGTNTVFYWTVLKIFHDITGTLSREGYFFKGLNLLISTFCVCVCVCVCVLCDGFQCLSKAFYYPIQFFTFYLLPWNYLLILKMLTEPLLRILFSVIGRYSLVPTFNWRQGECERINLSQTASGLILPNHRWLPVSIFTVKIPTFTIFVAGYWKDFQRHLFSPSHFVSNLNICKTTISPLRRT
jgi:hypothetical protein